MSKQKSFLDWQVPAEAKLQTAEAWLQYRCKPYMSQRLQCTVVGMLSTSKNDDNADECLPGVLIAKQEVGDNGDHDKLQGSQAGQHHLGGKTHGSKAQQVANAKNTPSKGHAQPRP